MTHVVKVIEYATGEVVKEIECDSEHSAQRTDRGLNINLDHERFYTLIVNKEAA